jgi:hypothetical protein
VASKKECTFVSTTRNIMQYLIYRFSNIIKHIEVILQTFLSRINIFKIKHVEALVSFDDNKIYNLFKKINQN